MPLSFVIVKGRSPTTQSRNPFVIVSLVAVLVASSITVLSDPPVMNSFIIELITRVDYRLLNLHFDTIEIGSLE